MIDEGQIARKRSDWRRQRGDELLENNEQRTTDNGLDNKIRLIDIYVSSARSQQNGDDEDDEDDEGVCKTDKTREAV